MGMVCGHCCHSVPLLQNSTEGLFQEKSTTNHTHTRRPADQFQLQFLRNWEWELGCESCFYLQPSANSILGSAPKGGQTAPAAAASEKAKDPGNSGTLLFESKEHHALLFESGECPTHLFRSKECHTYLYESGECPAHTASSGKPTAPSLL